MSRRSEGIDGRISIGQVARRFDLTERTLRFYDEVGVLIPHRIGAERFYSIHDLDLLKQIMMLKEVGYSISAISALVSARKDKDRDGPLLGEYALKKAIAVLSRKKIKIEAHLKGLDADLEVIAARRVGTPVMRKPRPLPCEVRAIDRAERDVACASSKFSPPQD